MKVAKVKQDSPAELPVRLQRSREAFPVLVLVMELKEEVATRTKNAVGEVKGLWSTRSFLTGSHHYQEFQGFCV